MSLLSPGSFLAATALALTTISTLAQPAPTTDEGPIVQLPAFVVEESKLEPPVHWLYAKVGEIEILSCCPAGLTTSYVALLNNQYRLVDWDFPPDLRGTVHPSLRLIIDDRPLVSLHLLPEANSPAANRVRNAHASATSTIIVRWDTATAYDHLNGTAAELSMEHLGNHSLIGGIFANYASVSAITQQPTPYWLRLYWGTALHNRHVESSNVVFTLDRSVGEAPGASLIKFTDALRPFTSGDFGAQLPQNLRYTFNCFIRWALYADGGAHRAAFWNFVRNNVADTASGEEQIQKYFGLSSGELDGAIAGFRDKTSPPKNLPPSRQSVSLKFPLAKAPPPPKVRDATEDEIGRFIGEWLWSQTKVAADLRPTVLPLARRALKRARKNGPGDPRVTALLGLVELADGHTAEAQALLESVAESADLPPLARFELAKLRYAATEAKLSVKATRFDAAQVAHIFSPLAPLRNNPPGDDGLIFGLIADTWSRAADQPNRDDLLQLAKSAPKFPKADRMLMQAATLCSAQDLKAEALALIEVGLGPKAPASSRAEFQKLKNEIAGGNSNSGAAAKGN